MTKAKQSSHPIPPPHPALPPDSLYNLHDIDDRHPDWLDSFQQQIQDPDWQTDLNQEIQL